MRISDWSSDVCSSDLFEAPQETSCSIARHTVHVVLEAAPPLPPFRCRHGRVGRRRYEDSYGRVWYLRRLGAEQDRTEAGIAGARRSFLLGGGLADRSEENTSELQSLMRTSYAAFCWQK